MRKSFDLKFSNGQDKGNKESYNYLDMTKGHLIKQYLFHIEIV